MITLIVLGAVVAFVVVFTVSSYNGLVRMRNQVDASWSQIDVQLKRRHDLIPNLVETVKGYASHERQTLEAVVAARAQAIGAQSPQAQAAATAVTEPGPIPLRKAQGMQRGTRFRRHISC